MAARIVPPRPPLSTIARPRLHELLDVGAECQVTTLVAPAGCGKTVLLSSWQGLEESATPIAWVRVGRRDDPGVFWHYVAAALADAGVAVPQPGEGLPWTPGGIIDALLDLHGRVILVIDNSHLISSAEIWAGLDTLVECQPRHVHLVISGRRVPDIALYRLRAADEITEISAADLAFTAAEAAELFAECEVEISPPTLADLLVQTRGWACGLRLAARQARRHPDPARVLAGFAAHDGDMADYLRREVLDRLPAPTRDVLARLSVLDPFSAELADTVAGRTDCARILDDLHRDDVFVERMGTSEPWYRFLPSLATALQRDFRALPPQARLDVHARAATWYEQRGMPDSAVHHWICGQRWDAAGRVVVDQVDGIACLGEHVPKLRQAPPGPDVGMLRASRPVLLAVAAERFSQGDLLGADAVLGLTSDSDDDPWPSRLATIVIRLVDARAHGDVDGMRRRAAELLDIVDLAEARRPGSGDRIGALARLTTGIAGLWTADLAAAEAEMNAAMTLARRSCLTALLVVASSWSALIAAARGRLDEASRLARSTLDAAEGYPWAATAMSAPAQTALAVAELHRGHAAAAGHWRGSARSLTNDHALIAVLAMVEAALQFDAGDAAGASRTLAAVHREHEQHPLPDALAVEVTMLDAELLAEQGYLAAARGRFEKVDGHRSAPRVRLTEARLLRAEHALQAALDVVRDLVPSAREQRPDLLAEALLLQAQLSYLLTESGEAFDAIEQACAVAAPETRRRPFEGPSGALRPLLREHLGRGSAHRTFIADLLAQDTVASAVSTGEPGGGLVEPLTDRERRVLWYMPSKLSNAEIAADLYVSVNTVKTHVKNIYRKLQVNGRREAAARARHLDLL